MLKYKLIRRLTNINNLVQETANLVHLEARDQNVHIEIITDDAIPTFNFYYNQIKQVLLNLVINALDAVKSGGHIKIQTRASNGTILLAVEDNGQGISMEDRRNIFNPFFTTKTRGTGLGLAISKKIAKEHGGDLQIESAPSKGSRFTLSLPIKT